MARIKNTNFNEDEFQKDLKELEKEMFDNLNPNSWVNKFARREKRFDKLQNYLESLNDKELDQLIKRLINEHTDEMIDKAREKGYEAPITRKMQLFFDWMMIREGKNGQGAVESICVNFPSEATEYRGYIFEIIFGQGALYRIYDAKDKNKKPEEYEVIFEW